MKVPLFDLGRQHAALEKDLRAAFDRVFTSTYFIMGPEVEGLERECADYLRVPETIAVSSGTDAILLTLMALGIGPGDEVLCPSYTFFATAGCVSRVGATPVFIDSTPCCYNIDPARIEERITPRTKAIIPVHLFGQTAEMGAILEIAKRHDLLVIEDAAQAIGAEYQGRRAGTLGEAGCFSFFPTKNLGALGDGGLVATRDPELAKRLRSLRTHGSQVKYYHESVGGNFRIDALQAAFLRAKLPHLDASHAARRANAARYNRLFLASGLAAFPTAACVCLETQRPEPSQARSPLLLPFACQPTHIYNQYVIRVPGAGRRDGLRTHLQAKGIGSEIYYPLPLHLQKCFEPLGYREGSLPFAETFARETVALPIFPELREEEIDTVAGEILSFLGEAPPV